MGRKKGRQSGRFSSKAQHAAYTTEFHANVCEAKAVYSNRSESNRRYNNKINVDKKDPRTNNDLNLAPTRIGRPSVNHLRGLLMERRWEDRFQDREIRLRSHVQRNNEANTCTVKVLQNPPGWIHFHQNEKDVKRENMLKWLKRKYNIQDRHALCKDDEIKKDNDSLKVNSLQLLCIKVLAPHLKNYIQHSGRDSIHSVISSLSSYTITLISIYSVCQNDDMVHVLGNHTHLDRLTLRFDQHMNLQNKESMKCPLDNAIMDLIPKVHHISADHLQDNFTGKTKQVSVPNESLSWENMLDDHENNHFTKDFIWRGCIQLTRLEIRDAPNISSSTIFSILQKCTKLTHLSLCNSLNSYTGMEVLLHPQKGIFRRNSSFLYIGEILDLSFCKWITSSILIQLLASLGTLSQVTKECKDYDYDAKLIWEEVEEDNYEKMTPISHPSLRIIRVVGCPFIDIEKCKSCSIELFGKSILSNEEHELET